MPIPDENFKTLQSFYQVLKSSQSLNNVNWSQLKTALENSQNNPEDFVNAILNWCDLSPQIKEKLRTQLYKCDMVDDDETVPVSSPASSTQMIENIMIWVKQKVDEENPPSEE